MRGTKELARIYELAKATGRLCPRCGWIIKVANWDRGARLCAGCEDALKGVNVSCRWGPYLDEIPDTTGEHI